MQRSRAFVLFCAVSGALSVLACSSEDTKSGGEAGRAGSGGTAGSLGIAGGLTRECIRCVVDTCGAEYDGCRTDVACQEVMHCALACQDEMACIQPCLDYNAPGAPIWQALYACVQSNCDLCITEH